MDIKGDSNMMEIEEEEADVRILKANKILINKKVDNKKMEIEYEEM